MSLRVSSILNIGVVEVAGDPIAPMIQSPHEALNPTAQLFASSARGHRLASPRDLGRCLSNLE